MTLGELRRLTAGLPDNAVVLAVGEDGCPYLAGIDTGHARIADPGAEEPEDLAVWDLLEAPAAAGPCREPDELDPEPPTHAATVPAVVLFAAPWG